MTRRAENDRFELLAPLGRGGMGEVSLARDRTSGEEVAVKRIHVEDAEDAARFLREVGALARLDHPRIVRLVAWGAEGSTAWLAMEHLPGGTLHELVGRNGPLGEREAALLGADLARALAHAHRAGVVHRDLKPQNLLLDAHGAVRLVDFGLARPLVRGDSLTASGALLGTPIYAAPELLDGRAREAGPQADVYGLGATLYFLLTGAPPFEGQSLVAQIEAVLRGPPEPPSRLRPGLDRDLEAIVLACMAPDPADRLLDAGLLARQLTEWADRPPGPSRGSLIAALAVGAGVLGLVVGGAALALRRAEATGPPAAPVASAAHPPATAREQVELGLLRVRRGDPDGLLQIDEALKRAASDSSDLLLLRAHALEHLGRPSAALAQAQAILARGRSEPAEALAGRLRSEREELARDAAQASSAAEAHLSRGLLDEALDLLGRALDAAPGDPRLLVTRARARLQAGDLEGAGSAARESITALRLEDPDTCVRAAALLIELRQRETAAALLDQVTARIPTHVPAWVLRGRMHLSEGRHAEVQSQIGVLLDLYPDPEALVLRGQALAAAGNTLGALKDAETALLRDPVCVPAEILAGMAAHLHQDRARAVQALERTAGRAVVPEDRVDRARLALLLERPEEAAPELRAALAANPRHGSALNELQALARELQRDAPTGEAARLGEQAREALERQDPAAAETAIAALLRLDPGSAVGHELEALTRLSCGASGQAREASRVALALTPPTSPEWPRRASLLARLEAEQGATATARVLLARVTALDPALADDLRRRLEER